MNWLRLPAAALSFVGRHGTLFAAASIFVGLAVPPIVNRAVHGAPGGVARSRSACYANLVWRP
jgi:hypothetical protein